MADPTTVNGHAKARVPGSAEFEGIAEFVDDLSSLAELQANLAAADFRESARKAAVPLVLTVVGLTVVVSSVPVALLAAGWLLASALRIDPGWATLLTAGTALTLGGLVAWLGGVRLSRSFDSFRRSRRQLWLNMAWVRAVLVTSASARSHPWRRSK